MLSLRIAPAGLLHRRLSNVTFPNKLFEEGLMRITLIKTFASIAALHSRRRIVAKF